MDRMQLMSIGDFARAAGLSPKALRIYDDLDLLRPAEVDERTGYRYYATDQLEPARLIELTWRWLNDGVPEPEEHVAITFDADDGGTRVGVDHPLDEANESPDGIRDGWESVLGRLRERFEAR